MIRWILVLAMIGMAVAPLALAQDAEPVPVATITFEPETYELYREFAAKGLKSMEERIADLDSLSPDNPEVLLGRNHWSPGPEQCEYLRTILTQSAIKDNAAGRYVLTVRGPAYLSPGGWANVTRDVFRCFEPYDAAAFEAKRAENDAKIEELQPEIEELEVKRTATREARSALRIESVRARLEARKETMLELRLAKAEAEARRETAMHKLEEARKQPDEAATQTHHLKSQYTKEKIALATKAVERVQKMVSQGLAASAELEQAEQALTEARLQAAMIEQEAGEHRPASPAETQLTGLLVEAEIDLAGLEGKGRVLGDEMASLQAILTRDAALEREYTEECERRDELLHQKAELKNWPKSPEDFPVPNPVIEWAQRPGEKEGR
jgi:hypothetical protein